VHTSVPRRLGYQWKRKLSSPKINAIDFKEQWIGIEFIIYLICQKTHQKKENIAIYIFLGQMKVDLNLPETQLWFRYNRERDYIVYSQYIYIYL